MRCHSCEQQAIIEHPARCKEHFIAEFEERVKRTIDEHGLIFPGERVAVAVSGGKDSLTVLTLLAKWFDVTAVAIDEGIAGYREHTLEDARRVCAERGIPLIVKSFKELTGMTLDEMLAKRTGASDSGGSDGSDDRGSDGGNGDRALRSPLRPCTVCGAFRRKLLSVASKGFDVLATGHNADDEAQTVLMNIIKGNTEVFPRLGPVSGHGAQGFVRRVKPLYFCGEKEVMTYAYLHGIVTEFNECPYVSESFRHIVRDGLNRYAQSDPAARQALLRRFLIVKETFPATSFDLVPCRGCGEPSSGGLCKACSCLKDIEGSTESF